MHTSLSARQLNVKDDVANRQHFGFNRLGLFQGVNLGITLTQANPQDNGFRDATFVLARFARIIAPARSQRHQGIESEAGSCAFRSRPRRGVWPR